MIAPTELQGDVAVISSAYLVTATGLTIADANLSFPDWIDIGRTLGRDARSVAWCVGDWLLYGCRRWGDAGDQTPRSVLNKAAEITGLEVSTLRTYLSVCRGLPEDERRDALSFAHHRAVVALPVPQREQWLDLVDPATQESTTLDSESKLFDSSTSESKVPTAKRLAMSVRLAGDKPRIVTDQEISNRDVGAGVDNYQPHLSRLVTSLRSLLPTLSAGDREVVRADLEPLAVILRQLSVGGA